MDIREALKKYFSYREFRFGQDEIIKAILKGQNCLAVMPTGGGKSLCYQLPAILLDGTAIVISPLIALMKDQTDALNKINIPATFINSTLKPKEIAERLDNAIKRQYKLIYIAPERLESPKFLNALKEVSVSFVAIDEAHCISQWGYDFRPSYLLIPKLLKRLNFIPTACFTATATPEVQQDIIDVLHLTDVFRVIKGFDRKNLSFITTISDDKEVYLLKSVLRIRDGCGIVYCGTRNNVEKYAELLKKNGVKAVGYHAGLNEAYRNQLQDDFIKGKAQIIVATNAFGMGIDKADVRKVIHCDIPSSLEAYYQEAGRAGRDGLDSECHIVYDAKLDRKLQEYFISTTYPDYYYINMVYDFLYDYKQVAIGQKAESPILLDENQIANEMGLSAYIVKSVMNLFERHNIIQKGSLSKNLAGIKFITSPERLREYYQNTTFSRKVVLEALLRYCPPTVFESEHEFNIKEFLYKYNIKEKEFEDAIKSFSISKLLVFNSNGLPNGFYLTQERYDFQNVPIDFHQFYLRKELAIKKLNVMEEYIFTRECKRNFILRYFGDNDYFGTCGKCSSCRAKK